MQGQRQSHKPFHCRDSPAWRSRRAARQTAHGRRGESARSGGMRIRASRRPRMAGVDMACRRWRCRTPPECAGWLALPSSAGSGWRRSSRLARRMASFSACSRRCPSARLPPQIPARQRRLPVGLRAGANQPSPRSFTTMRGSRLAMLSAPTTPGGGTDDETCGFSHADIVVVVIALRPAQVATDHPGVRSAGCGCWPDHAPAPGFAVGVAGADFVPAVMRRGYGCEIQTCRHRGQPALRPSASPNRSGQRQSAVLPAWWLRQAGNGVLP